MKNHRTNSEHHAQPNSKDRNIPWWEIGFLLAMFISHDENEMDNTEFDDQSTYSDENSAQYLFEDFWF